MSRVLLCLNEADCSPALKSVIFGRPLLFHTIKNLQAIGFTEIAVAIETVPPELLDTVDQLHKHGVDIALLRTGPEIAAFAATPGLMLVQSAAVWASRTTLDKLVQGQKKSVLSLPEDQRFQNFERIDLARRWAGLAVMESRLVQRATDIPQGWSTESYLLRLALQAGYPDEQVSVENTPIPTILHGAHEGALSLLARNIQPETATHGLPDRALNRLFDGAIDRFTGNSWWDAGTQWAMPIIALFAVGLAYFGLPIASFWSGFLALIAGSLRRRVKEVAYRPQAQGAVEWLSFTSLSLALVINLRSGNPLPDSLFLAFVLFALATISAKSGKAVPAGLLSPTVIAFWLAIMASADLTDLAIKLAIAAIAAALTVPAMRNQS